MPASSSDCQNHITCANLPPAFLIASPHTPITHAALSELKRIGARTTRIDPIANSAFVRSSVLGLAASHAAAWRAIIDRELPGGMVFEDDVIFHNDFCELLPQYWRELPCEPSFVYLGGGMRTKVLSNHVRVHQESSRRVHTGADETAVPPWTTHAYYVSADQAQLLLRRFDYSLMRMNLTSSVAWKPESGRDAGWDASTTMQLPPIAPHLFETASDCFLINQFLYFTSDLGRSRWAWFDSTTETPAKVGSMSFWKAPDDREKMSCPEAVPTSRCACGLCGRRGNCACDLAGVPTPSRVWQPRLQQWRVHPPSLDCAPPKNGTCEILRASPQQRQQWLRWNPFDIRCETTPDAAYRPVHRATGLAYQAYHFPCASVCRSCRVVHDVRSMALDS